MKTSFLLAAAILAAGCNLLDDGMFTGSPHGRNPERPGAQDDQEDGNGIQTTRTDTLIYYSAVEVLDGYDWRRDIGFGNARGRLSLHRDGELVTEFETSDCAGIEPDRHHIIDGHLYTEHFSGTQTVIGRDGAEICRFDGREILKGLLQRGEDIYTLSQNCDGYGISLRKNSETVLTKDEGRIFGDFSDPSYGPTGALYEDGDKYCFCYWNGSAAEGKRYYRVDNGQESLIESFTAFMDAQDIKIFKGKTCVAAGYDQGRSWTGARIWMQDDWAAVSGDSSGGDGRTAVSSVYDINTGQTELFSVSGADIYLANGVHAAVSYGRDGSIKTICNGKASPMEGEWYWFSPGCAALRGGELVLALTPRDSTARPVLKVGAEIRDTGIKGYLTGVQVVYADTH